MGEHIKYPYGSRWVVHLWIPFGNNPGGVRVMAIHDENNIPLGNNG